MHNPKRSKQKAMGALLFLFGIFIVIYSGTKFTGFAISQGNAGGFFFIGIILMVGGILLVGFGKQSQLEIKLYKEAKKDGKKQIYMTDPENLFGTNGIVTLEKFREDMDEIRKDPELFDMIKQSYFAPLMEKYSEGGVESELAEQYLVEMGFEPENEEKTESEEESRYALPKEEITKIKTAFSDRKEKITPGQKKILANYDLVYTSHGNRIMITPQQGGERIIVGISPNDRNAGKRISSQVLRLCDAQYRKKAK
jgi:hypothetical protein